MCDADNQLVNVSATAGGMPTNYTYAYDAGGNRLQESIGGSTRTFTYNALNQLTSASDPATTNATYEWDADQKLTAINTGLNRSEFSYDGLARLSRIVEKSNNIPVSEKRFVWSSGTLCQERGSDNSLVKQFFSQGVMLASGPLYYARDHLGSIREVTDAAGTLRAEYAYQPYGRGAKLAGDLDSDFGFTGIYRHVPSGLLWALYRAYDPANARWVTRDPLGEYIGPNLYRYVDNSLINFSDPLGLKIQVAEADKADYEKAVAYLKQDSEMARIFKQLEDSDTVYKLITNDNNNDAYYENNHSIHWDPHSALRTSCGGKQSPALGLGHEADHAAAEDEQLARTKSNKYENLEERRVIRGSEAHAAKTLGEDQRFDHDGSTYPVADPTAR